jgi:histidine triad (HIT) family protein
MAKSVFQRIIDREIPADVVYEDELCLAFRDVNPQAPVHLLIIPKQPVEGLDQAAKPEQSLLGHLLLIVGEIARTQNLERGYRVVTNCGEWGGQSVRHLHFHLLGGRAMNWPPG